MMDKTTRQQVLASINQLRLSDLMGIIRDGDITLQEMIDAGLNPQTVAEIEASYKEVKQHQVTESEVVALCRQVEGGEKDAEQIRDMMLEGKVTEEQLLKNTSLTPELITKIRNYQKSPTDFQSWSDLPPLQTPRTDLYFFGQPGSGKSCILASLFYFLERERMIIENVHNPQGVRYRNQLSNEISYGILPYSTAAEGVNYIPIELKNHDLNGVRHPLNFIEMSGELFNRAYDQGISDENLAARDYLNNDNRKLIYFVVDYDQHEKSRTTYKGPLQSSMMQAILALLDQFGTLKKTDGIFIVVSKADLFPPGVDRKKFAAEFLEANYGGFLENCREMKSQYRNQFKIIAYPYSIGEVKFQNMLTRFDDQSARDMIQDVLANTFSQKKSFFNKLFN
jgi:hypothetical protein